jgi:hypothetical protein
MSDAVWFIAITSLLFFEGMCRVLLKSGFRAGIFCILLAAGVMAAHYYTQSATHSMALKAATLFEPISTTRNPQIKWTELTKELPNLPVAERAEKTRILASSYYLDTGQLVDHIALSGEAIRFTPTQEELTQREQWIAARTSTLTRVDYTRTNHIDLIAIPLLAFLFSCAATRRERRAAGANASLKP